MLCTCEWEDIYLMGRSRPLRRERVRTDAACPKHGTDKEVAFQAVVRGDMSPQEYVTHHDPEAPARIEARRAKAKKPPLPRIETRTQPNPSRPPQKRRERLQDPITRYLSGQLDTVAFLLEYDRQDVAPLPYTRHMRDPAEGIRMTKEWR